MRPFIDPRKSLVQFGAHLFGFAPVVRGTGVDLLLGTDERAILDARDVTGVRGRVVAVGSLDVESRRKVPASTSSWQSSSYSSADPSHQWIRSGVVSRATSSTHSMKFLVRVGYIMRSSSTFGSPPQLRRTNTRSHDRAGRPNHSTRVRHEDDVLERIAKIVAP